jgi:ketosteroid isomerase-like protein
MQPIVIYHPSSQEIDMTQPNQTAIQEVIKAADEKFVTAYNEGDAAAVAECYTEGGQVLMPNFDVIAGRQAIRMMWQGAMNMMGYKKIALETTEVEEYEDTAYEVGKYTLLGKNGNVMDVGKYIVIWKQDGGEWKLHRDIMNSSRPAPGHLPNPMSAILKLVSRRNKV